MMKIPIRSLPSIPVYQETYCNQELTGRSRIEFYLRDEESAGRVPSLSMLGMVDFIYEIDRRIRKALGLFDIPVVGNPLAPSPEGPFPELVNLPIHKNSNTRGETQENIDYYTNAIYERHHKVMYACCEHMRRLLNGGISSSLLDVARRVVSSDNVAPVFDCHGAKIQALVYVWHSHL